MQELTYSVYICGEYTATVFEDHFILRNDADLTKSKHIYAQGNVVEILMQLTGYEARLACTYTELTLTKEEQNKVEKKQTHVIVKAEDGLYSLEAWHINPELIKDMLK